VDKEADWFYLQGFRIDTSSTSLNVTDKNITECLVACIEHTDFNCYSVVSHKLDPSYCTLYATDRSGGNILFVPDADYEYWEALYKGLLQFVYN